VRAPDRRLGITVPLEGVPLSEAAELAAWLEDVGYTDAWTVEINGPDGFTPLIATAAGTKRLRIGTAIVSTFTRPAPLLAMHALALAELAPGRFVLGLGCSTATVVHDWMGLPFERPLERTREVAATVRGLLRGERAGAFKLARPAPAEVPIYIAALGGQMLRLAAEVGDGIALFMAGPRIMREMLSGLPAHVEPVARLPLFAGDDLEECARHARRLLTGYAIVPYYARHFERQGFGGEVAAINARWREGDRAGAANQVSEAMLRELVLLGGPDDWLEKLDQYRQAGLSTPIVNISSPDARQTKRAAQQLAQGYQ
jgi:probable F420-dependent oxidoreductase